MDAILVPGGFGKRGVEGKIAAIRFARENRRALPRHLPRHAGRRRSSTRATWPASTAPTAPSSIRDTPHPVIALITEWQDRDGTIEKRDATLRPRRHDAPGRAERADVVPGTLAHAIYGDDGRPSGTATATRSNNQLPAALEAAGLVVSARTPARAT